MNLGEICNLIKRYGNTHFSLFPSTVIMNRSWRSGNSTHSIDNSELEHSESSGDGLLFKCDLVKYGNKNATD